MKVFIFEYHLCERCSEYRTHFTICHKTGTAGRKVPVKDDQAPVAVLKYRSW